MDIRQILRIDLNLLVALHALLEERSVSKAAERVFVTQSAMSKSLGRLRTLFDDPLFVRTPKGMVPTPKATQLQPVLHRILRDIDQLVLDDQFDPKTASADVHLAVGSYVGIVLLPVLVDFLQRRAPGIRVHAFNRVERQLERLADGSLDFALHMRRAQYGSEFDVHLVGAMPPVWVARDTHPLVGKQAEEEDVLSYPHVHFYVSDQRELEQIRQFHPSEKRGGSRENVVFETSHLPAALEVLRRTDCVMLAPPAALHYTKLSDNLTQLNIASSEDAVVSYTLVNHERLRNSPLHTWFRRVILDICTRLERRRQLGEPFVEYQPGQYEWCED
ncbi:LysR family transcriptional regulator [Marinibactrum halimedae]|uniref:LysR family transcriptional regulator n=1 Tax=Marinibactrum halimedae TaxID=1444977 RepID=UPI001E2F3B47|nr:LysR family transcriptional regulator [Marinibactrum halimedae]MCD9459712.1 LysR family transcriptional regulator [Marinibactrum halimedae]